MIELDADVIIVGFSVAGIQTLLSLEENGINNVIVFEKKKIGRVKSCAGGITNRALEKFPITKLFIDSDIYTSGIVSPNLVEKVSYTSNGKPLIGMTLSRADFDGRFANHVMNNTKAKIITNMEVTDVEINKDKAIVHTKDGKKYSCFVVIGADSVQSTVAKSLDIGIYESRVKSKINKYLRVAIERTVLFDNSENVKKNNLEILTYICFENIEGYAWYFPRSNGANIGIIANKGKDFRKMLEKFQNHLIEVGLIPKNADFCKIYGAMLPARKMYDKRVSDRAILVGDAGGFCFPSSGEGIMPSMVSGKIAGELVASLIKKYHNASNPSIANELTRRDVFLKGSLKKYIKLTNKHFKSDFRIYYLAQRVMSNPRFNMEMVRWCQKDEDLKRKIFEALYGDRPSLSFQLIMLKKYIQFKLKRREK